MAIIFIVLAVLSGMSTIVLLAIAATLNQAMYIVFAIIAGLFTWLFAYMADNMEL